MYANQRLYETGCGASSSEEEAEEEDFEGFATCRSDDEDFNDDTNDNENAAGSNR